MDAQRQQQDLLAPCSTACRPLCLPAGPLCLPACLPAHLAFCCPQLDINIHVDGAKDCQHVGYGPRYSADGDRYQSPRPMYDSYGPREQYEREPYRYRGSHEEQQPDSYNYAEEPGLHNRYSEYEQRAYGEGADHPYQHTYSYRHHEATNTYNFRALPGTEETTLAGGSTDNLPVIISYK